VAQVFKVRELSMDELLEQLCDIDHQLLQLVEKDELSAEEILGLVDTREQLLKRVINAVEQAPELAQTEQWSLAVKRTQQVVITMEAQTQYLGQKLRQYRHGSRSLAQYKKFI
jgi:flagellar rod protein FlaI